MKKILIVDDDEDILDLVKISLSWYGFDVHTHARSFNIPEVVKFCHPHLILLDIGLFGKSGTQICKELKQRHHIPIILVSGDTKKGESFADCDADAFIEKPFNMKQLVKAINLHLN
ncbi:MAG: response regulator [Ginsengibacter sp.]